MLNFGRKLRHLRQQHNLTQAALAHTLHLANNSFVSLVETGEKAPPLDLVVRVAVLFGVSADYLLRDEVPITPPVPSVGRGAATGATGATGLGHRLRQLRTAQGLSQVQLAARAHLSAPSFLSHIEAGRKQPSPAVLVRLADALGVAVDDLLLPT